MQDMAKGRVLVMYRDGSAALTDAIQRGVMSAQAQREASALIARNDQLERELDDLRSRNRVLESAVRAHHATDLEARQQYMAHRRDARGQYLARRGAAIGLTALGLCMGFSLMGLVAMYIFGGA